MVLAIYFPNLAMRPSSGAWSGACVGNCAAFHTSLSQPELLHWVWGLAPYFPNWAMMPSSGAWPGALIGFGGFFCTIVEKTNFYIGCGPGTLLFQVGPDAFFWGLAWGLCCKLCRFLHIRLKTKTSTLAVDLAPYFSNLALRPSSGAWSGACVGNCAIFITFVWKPKLPHCPRPKPRPRSRTRPTQGGW